MIKLDLQSCNQLQGQLKHWAYNALDCTGTREVFDTLWDRTDDCVRRYYNFTKALQNPALAMMRRGVRVDLERMKEASRDILRALNAQEKAVNKIPKLVEVWDGAVKETGKCPKNEGKKHRWPKGEPDATRSCSLCGMRRMQPSPFNPQSSHQTRRLFYVLLGLPEMRGKTGAVTTDDDALQRIGNKHSHLRELTDGILEYRNLKKQLGFMKSKLSADGRWRQSVNVGAAWTGRFSSSKNPFGEGNNLANVSERHRYIFCADPGYTMFYADLKTAESNVVAHLAGDEGYIEAHKSGDVHTVVCRLVWPELPWTGDLSEDKRIAQSNYPEWDNVAGHDFRFQAKRIQHGSNYGLTPQGISMIAKIPLHAAKKAWYSYMDAFPGIRAWQGTIRQSVKASMPLTNPLGFRVSLFGRPWDEHTIKQGLAFKPQSTVAMVLNLGMWKVWRDLESERVLLLANVYDAVLGQFPSGTPEIVPEILARLTIPFAVVDIHGVSRELTIPAEISCGKNWGKRTDDNPNGLA